VVSLANNDGLSQNIELNVSVNQQSVQKAQQDIAKISMAKEIQINIKDIKASGGRKDAAEAIAAGLGVQLDTLVVGKLKKLGEEVEKAFDKASLKSSIEGLNLGDLDTPLSLLARKYNDVVDNINSSIESLGKMSGIKVSEDASFGLDETLFAKLNSKNEKVAAKAAREIGTFITSLEKIANGYELKNKELLNIADFNYSIDGAVAKRSYGKKDGTRTDAVRKDVVEISPALVATVANKLIQQLGNELAFSNPNQNSKWYNRPNESTSKPSAPRELYAGKDAPEKATAAQVKNFEAEILKSARKGNLDALQVAFAEKVVDIFDDITKTLVNEARKTILGFGNIQKLIATDPTFSANGLASEDSMAGTLRYVTEKLQEMLPDLEANAGLQPGTYLRYGKDFKSAEYGTTFDQLPDAGGSVVEPGFINKVLSEAFGEIKGEITNVLPDAVQENIAYPIEQIMANPYIFGKGMVTQTSGQLTKVINSVKNRGLTTESMMPKEAAKGFVGSSSGDSLWGGKDQLNLVASLIEANQRNLEITTSPADKEARAKRIADLTEELKLLEAKYGVIEKTVEVEVKAEKKAAEPRKEKQVGIIAKPIPELKQKANEPAAVAASIMPTLDKYRPVIGDAIVDQIVKVISEAGGDASKITAAFDTEFIEGNKKPIYEAGVTLKNEIGQFIDIFKMVQVPVGKQSELDYRLAKQGAGADSVAGIKGRAFKLGISRHDIGTGAGDEADMMQYRDKLIQLGTVIQALDEVGVKLAGNKIVDADFRILAQSFQSVNDALAGVEGIDQIKVPSPTNVADLLKIVEILKKTPGLHGDLQTLVQGKIEDGKDKGDTKLGALLNKVLDMRPQMEKRYDVTRNGSDFAFGDTPAHYAVADNRAALIVLEFLKGFAQSANLIASGTGILGEKYGNGTAGPYGNKARADYPSAFGGGFAVDPAERAAAAEALVQETNAQESNNKAVKSGRELAAKRLADDKEYQSLLEKLADARKAYQAANSATANNGVIDPADKAVLEAYLVKLDELAETSKVAATAAASLRTAMGDPSKQNAFRARRDVKAFGEELSLKKSEMAYKSEAAVKEVSDKRKAQSGKNYENTAIQVEKNITRAASDRARALKEVEGDNPVKPVFASATEVPGDNRTRILGIEEETKARRDASETIKRIYKDQVQAEKDVQAATKASVNQWVTGRYALYDVGNAYQNVSTQLFRVARRIFDITKSYRDYETAFTSVERAMQLDFSDPAGGAKELKDQFIALSEVIPVAFEELSRIATLGAQMGIGAQGIVKFTETVAQFSAVTGIAADTVAQKFGKIAELTNLPSDQFDKLGSAVTFAGVNAVATESEILTLSESIAAVSNQAGMTTPDVVGLGTALSSVGIPAEQARGVFTRVFADIDRAVATGGKSLEAFASTAGMSGEDFSAAWGQDGKSYDVFRAMLGGINSAADLTKAFDKLGITETREVNTLTRLANNLNVVDGAMTDAAASFGDGQFLLDSFAKTTDNLDSRIAVFQNNLKSLGESLGQVFGGTLKDALDVGSKVLEFMKGMSESPLLRYLSLLSAGTVVFVGAMAGVGAVLAKVTAQIYAFRVAAINSANNTGDIDNSIKKIKQLTNVGGGLIEMRDKLLTGNADVRGEIVPKNYSLMAFARGEKAKQAYLLKTENIFLASNREQADSLQRLILLRQHEIEGIMTSSAATGVEATAKRAALAAEALYVEVIGNEVTALNANQYAELKAAAAAEVAARVKNGEATARLKNVQAITAETRAATGAGLAAGGAMTTFMGFLGAAGIAATVLTTVIGVVQGITMAAEEAKKIDLAGSGLGIEALRETIKEDTQVWKDSGEAIAVQSSKFVETEATANKYAQAISGLSTELDKAYGSQQQLVDVTKEQSVAFGQATKELILNAILANDKIQELVDKNANMFNDLAGMGFNASDMVDAIMGDPEKAQEYLDGIARGVEELDKKIRIAKFEASEYVALDNGAEIRALEQSKKELEALGTVGAEAMAQIDKAINLSKIADVMKGYSQSFLGLEAKMKSAIKTGKGMASVMKLIKAASYDLIKNSDIKVNFDGAKSVKEMLKVTEAAKQTALALLNLRLAASNASPTAAGAAQAALAAQFEPLERNLKALANSSTTSADTVGGAAESAADKLKRLLGAANSAVSAAMNLNSALRSLGTALKGSTDWSLGTEGAQEKFNAILAVINQIGENAGNNFPKAIRELQAFQIVLKDMGAPQTALNLVGNAIKAIGGDATLTAKQVTALKKAFPSLFANMEKQLTGAASKAIKTLSEYASDLKSVLASAFEYRYSKQMGLDDIANAWQGIKDSAESAQQAMDDANKTIMGLNADRNLLEYQLKIAVKYKDIERQKFLTNKLAETNASLAEESKKIAEANATKDKSLKNDTKSSIENRNQVRGLVQTYTNYLTTLAATGTSADGLKAEAKKLAAEFLTQGVNLGFAKSELEDYTKAFEGDFTTVLGGLPSEITLAVNTDPALRAIEEFVKKANAELGKVAIVGQGQDNAAVVNKPTKDQIQVYQDNKEIISTPYMSSIAKNDAKESIKFFEKSFGNAYATGGFVSGAGTGTSDSIPARLSNGEFVMSAGSVSRYGVDFLNALNQQRVGFSPVQPQAQAQQQSSSQMVYLSPEDRQLLRAAIDRPVALYTENTKIAASANAGNLLLAQRGSN
jgi:TP901 family phage tail tape measure protein